MVIIPNQNILTPSNELLRVDRSHPIGRHAQIACFLGDAGGLAHYDSAQGKFLDRNRIAYSTRGFDEFGQHVNFHGTGTGTLFDYIELGNPPELQITDELTIIAGIVKDGAQPTNWGRIISKTNGTTGDRWALAIEDNPDEGEISFRIEGDYLRTGFPMVNGTYYDVCCTYKSGDRNIYIDEALAANDSLTGAMTASNNVRIGAHGSAVNRYFNGKIYYVIVLDKVISQDDFNLFRQDPRQILERDMGAYFIEDAAPPAGSIINQLQGANLGADLYNGTIL